MVNKFIIYICIIILNIAFSKILIVPEDFLIISDAIEYANINDTILIKDGIYNQNFICNKGL